MAVRPRAARQSLTRQKPTEVGEAAKWANRDKTLVGKGRLHIAGYPRRGEGCGEPLNDLSDNGIFFKEGSNVVL
jgi:hypothetical protein